MSCELKWPAVDKFSIDNIVEFAVNNIVKFAVDNIVEFSVDWLDLSFLVSPLHLSQYLTKGRRGNIPLFMSSKNL